MLYYKYNRELKGIVALVIIRDSTLGFGVCALRVPFRVPSGLH